MNYIQLVLWVYREENNEKYCFDALGEVFNRKIEFIQKDQYIELSTKIPLVAESFMDYMREINSWVEENLVVWQNLCDVKLAGKVKDRFFRASMPLNSSIFNRYLKNNPSSTFYNLMLKYGSNNGVWRDSVIWPSY